MSDEKVKKTMSKIIDVPGKIDFHVAVDDEENNVTLIMVGTNNSKKIRMFRAFNDLTNIDLIIERLQKAKGEVEALRQKAADKQQALKDARFIDSNVVDFIKWKQYAGLDLGPIGKELDVSDGDGGSIGAELVQGGPEGAEISRKQVQRRDRNAVEIHLDGKPDPVNDPSTAA